jgi:ribonuclease HI
VRCFLQKSDLDLTLSFLIAHFPMADLIAADLQKADEASLTADIARVSNQLGALLARRAELRRVHQQHQRFPAAEDHAGPLSSSSPAATLVAHEIRALEAVSARDEVATMLPTAAAIFVDGACSRNGRPDALAAWAFSAQVHGVEVLYKAERLSAAEKHSNIRAELHAVLQALHAAQELRGLFLAAGATALHVFTDLDFTLDVAFKYGPQWDAADWAGRVSGEEIKNLDLVRPFYDAFKTAQADAELPLVLHFVEGHSKAPTWTARSNNRVDTLAKAAVKGTALPPPPPWLAACPDADPATSTVTTDASGLAGAPETKKKRRRRVTSGAAVTLTTAADEAAATVSSSTGTALDLSGTIQS